MIWLAPKPLLLRALQALALVCALLVGGVAAASPPAQRTSRQARLGAGHHAKAPRFLGQSIRLGEAPSQVELVDLDGDGDLDLATTNYEGPTFSVALNLRAAEYGSARDYEAGAPSLELAIGDFDGDGSPDLAAALGAGGVAVALNQGDGTFAAPVITQVGVNGGTRSVTGLAVGDVDGNGTADIAVAMAYVTNTMVGPLCDGRAAVLANSGTGTFVQQSEELVGSPAMSAWLPSVALTDLDGSGTLDLVLSVPDDEALSLLLNQGGGAFAPQLVVPVSTAPGQVLAGDLDGDLDPDLAFLNGVGGVSVLFNTGAGFGAESSYLQAMGSKRLVSGDLEGDGDLDLAVAGLTPSFAWRVAALLNQGNGAFDAPLNTQCPDPIALSLGDLNGDGMLDVAACNVETVFLRYNAGDGHFLEPPFASLPVGAHPDHL